ncbi:hypothetical protein LUZ61_011738 [Rhynchospora tenuis]|uniref:Enhancer of rudimentary homolog n=1 Tax=Rhynchospora tenuis TaxID=198213 RepID=A0AAD6A1R5_9POAL|nr:hypothetical protein LUZ61_011738 [Rhynchospora tenuis]
MAFSGMQNRHTIILMQTTQSRASRTFQDYDSISRAMDGICNFYERKLREINPTNQHISYDISDLYNFIDGLADLSALVFDHNIQASLQQKGYLATGLLQGVFVFLLIICYYKTYIKVNCCVAMWRLLQDRCKTNMV